MKSLETLLESLEDIQEYCESTPKFAEFVSIVKDIRIELELQLVTQLNIEHSRRNPEEVKRILEDSGYIVPTFES